MLILSKIPVLICCGQDTEDQVLSRRREQRALSRCEEQLLKKLSRLHRTMLPSPSRPHHQSSGPSAGWTLTEKSPQAQPMQETHQRLREGTHFLGVTQGSGLAGIQTQVPGLS